MTKSSIHILPVKSGSERHNNRLQDLSYVRKDLSYLNESFQIDSIASRAKFVQDNCLSKTKRTMQSKATPIREGVLIIEETTTINDLMKLAQELEKEFGIKTIQAYTHKDEGHYDKITGKWKPNYHAHMVFDWTDHQKGKIIRLDKQDMARMQTIVADTLGLERGRSSDVKHLNAIEFKAEKIKRDIEAMEKMPLSKLKKEGEFLKMTNEFSKKKGAELKTENDILRVENQKLKEYNQALKEEIQNKKNRGFRL